MSDIVDGSTLEMLSKKNRLRRPMIFWDDERMIEMTETGPNIYFQNDFGFKPRIFVHNLLASMRGLKKFKIIEKTYDKFRSRSLFNNIFVVLGAAPCRIHELDIHGVGLWRMPAEAGKIIKSIQRICSQWSDRQISTHCQQKTRTRILSRERHR